MRRVTGIGGIFFKAKEPEALYAWYERHLGIRREADGSGVTFQDGGMTVWSIFKPDSTYYGGQFMINFRVDNLDALLAVLKTEGVEIDPERFNAEYGKFAWIFDPEGNKVELWEPSAQH